MRSPAGRDEDERKGQASPRISQASDRQAAASSSSSSSSAAISSSAMATGKSSEGEDVLPDSARRMLQYIAQLAEGTPISDIQSDVKFAPTLSQLRVNAQERDPTGSLNYILGCLYETGLIETLDRERSEETLTHFQTAAKRGLLAATKRLGEMAERTLPRTGKEKIDFMREEMKQCKEHLRDRVRKLDEQIRSEGTKLFPSSRPEAEAPLDPQVLKLLDELTKQREDLTLQIIQLEEMNPAEVPLPIATTLTNIQNGQCYEEIAEQVVEEEVAVSEPVVENTVARAPARPAPVPAEGPQGKNEEEKVLKGILNSLHSLTLSSPDVLGSPNFLGTMEELFPVIEALRKRANEGKAHLQPILEKVRNKPITLLVGGTGAGKTALTEWLKNIPLIAKCDPNSQDLVLDSKTGKIGHGSESKTTIPDVEEDPVTHQILIDCPGFEETRGTLHDTEEAILVAHVLKVCSHVRFLLVINNATFEAQRGEGVVEHVRRLKAMVPNVNPNNLSLLVTQIQPLERAALEATQRVLRTLGISESSLQGRALLEPLEKGLISATSQRLTSIRSHLRDLAARSDTGDVYAFLEGFARDNSRVALFSRPLHEGDFERNDERDVVRNVLSDISLFSLSGSTGFVPSVKAERDLQKIEESLEKYLNHVLVHQIASCLEDYQQTKKSQVKNVVDAWHKKAMKKFGPLTFFVSATEAARRVFEENPLPPNLLERTGQVAGAAGVAAYGAAGVAAAGGILGLEGAGAAALFGVRAGAFAAGSGGGAAVGLGV